MSIMQKIYLVYTKIIANFAVRSQVFLRILYRLKALQSTKLDLYFPICLAGQIGILAFI